MRLFIGIGIPPSAQKDLSEAAAALASVMPGRFVPPERYHITLAFLGQRNEDSLAPLQTILHATAAGSDCFPVTIEGFGQFGDKAVVYAAVPPEKALVSLCDTLKSRLSAAGEPFDPQPFTPHITLAHKAVLPADLPLFSPITFTADALTLFHSTRVDGTLRYLPIDQALFGTA